MDGMPRSLQEATNRLSDFYQQFDRLFRANGINAGPLQEILAVSEWSGSQISMLAYRSQTIRELGKGAGAAFLMLPDQLTAFDDARGLATMYSQDIMVHGPGDLQARLVHEHADEIAELADNPQAAAAFFAMLSPTVRNALPSLLVATGSKTAKQDLAAFSKALGAALRAPASVPAFERFKNDFLNASTQDAAWNRLALLKGAGAPTSYRIAAVRALALDDFATNSQRTFRPTGPSEAEAYGYPSDTVGMALEVIADDGAAVRDAFTAMGGPQVKLTRTEKMKLFVDYAKRFGGGEKVADALGRALVSGSEATAGTPGKHSPEAATFAFDAIRMTGSFGEKLPVTAQNSMGLIAQSYVHELITGGRFDKAIDRSSGMGRPPGWTDIPGVTPAFYLSPGDTFHFLRTFMGNERATDKFDSAVAQFYHDTMVTTAGLDGKQATQHFDHAATMFGDFAGIEFKAASDVRGQADAIDELVIDMGKNTLALGIDSVPVAGAAIDLTWTVAKTYAVSRLLDGWAESFETRVEKLDAKHVDYVERQRYEMARLLREGGFPATRPPDELISKETGQLKTYDEILKEVKREAAGGDEKKVLREKLTLYERWSDGNQRLDEKMEDAARSTTSTLTKELIDKWS
ncbi:hypothetical protein AB0J71_38065 [Nonomuraea sp. NPDC049637]|uniref:hypothetical protein n=1 Tax=Nonomuraea sp. NPDC049637 TaxID=3154356 RepID=UPI0034388F94